MLLCCCIKYKFNFNKIFEKKNIMDIIYGVCLRIYKVLKLCILWNLRKFIFLNLVIELIFIIKILLIYKFFLFNLLIE